MQLKEEIVKLGNSQIVVRELPMRAAFVVMEKLRENSMEGQIALFAAAVTVDGAQLTIEDVDGMGMSMYTTLIPIVMRVNGLGDAAVPH